MVRMIKQRPVITPSRFQVRASLGQSIQCGDGNREFYHGGKTCASFIWPNITFSKLFSIPVTSGTVYLLLLQYCCKPRLKVAHCSLAFLCLGNILDSESESATQPYQFGSNIVCSPCKVLIMLYTCTALTSNYAHHKSLRSGMLQLPAATLWL